MAKKQTTYEQKVNYLRIGLALNNIPCDNVGAEYIIKTYEGILKLGGEFSIKDSCRIDEEIKLKYSQENQTTK